MSVDLHAGEETVGDVAAHEGHPGAEQMGSPLPRVAGDLPAVLSAAPMFRRTIAGYDRYEVESYVRWAEDELAAADREREHMTVRQLQTMAALEEARELLAHRAGGGEFLDVSKHLGAMLATAADEAEAMRAEADADRQAAAAQAERTIADAERAAAEAAAAAARTVAAAEARAAGTIEQAHRTLAEAEQARARTEAEAQERLAQVRDVERRAAEQAQRLREQVADEIAVARLQARDELVALLTTGRDRRRQADEAAADARKRQDVAAAAQRSALLARTELLQAEVRELEHRVAELRGQAEVPVPRDGRRPSHRAAPHRLTALLRLP